jgi:hypothetical protein
MMMRFRRRSGQGTVIIIAALFILIMAVMQIAQSFLLSQIGDQTTRSGLGRMCALVVESAVEEARVLMAVKVNTSGDALFEQIRREGPGLEAGKTVGKKVIFKPEQLPRLAKLMATETGKNVEIVEVSCEVQAGRPLAAGYPYDVDGVLVYKARARASIDRSIVRDLEETQGYKVGQVALPAPMGKYPLIIRDPYRMLFGARQGDAIQTDIDPLNDYRKRITDDLLPKLKAKHADTLKEIDELIAKDIPSLAPDWVKKMQDFAKKIRPLYAKVTNDGGKNHFETVEALGREVKAFPDAQNQVAFYMMLAQIDGIELEKINVQWRLAQKLPELKAKLDEVDRLGAQAQARINAKDDSDASYQLNVQLSEGMIAELGMLTEILGYMQSVQIGLKPLERSANQQAYDYMLQQTAAFDPWQLGVPFNSLAQRAFYRIAEETGPGAVSVQAQWDRLKKRLDAFGGGFSGVVYVDNRTESFTLEGPLSGNLVIAVSGKVMIRDFKPKFQNDTLTVVARGGDGGPQGTGAVGLSGTIGASISTRGVSLNIEAGTVITGTLILDEIPLTLQKGLTGTVVADPRLADTSKPAFWYVSLSPWVRSRTTLRS